MQKNIKRFFLIFLGALTFAAILQTNLLAKEDKKEVNSVTDKLTAEQPAEKSSTENTKMMEKKAKKIFEKFSALHFSSTKKLTLKFKGFKKPPFLVFEGKF